MDVIIINGYPRSGKDTFCETAIQHYKCCNYSTVDTVKQVARIMGWDGNKTPEDRAMLSGLKDFYVKWFDGTFIEMTKLIMESVNDVDFVFLHIREPPEIARIRQWCCINNIRDHAIFIKRNGTDTELTNHADRRVEQYSYNAVIKNNGSLDKYRSKTLKYLESLKLRCS